MKWGTLKYVITNVVKKVCGRGTDAVSGIMKLEEKSLYTRTPVVTFYYTVSK